MRQIPCLSDVGPSLVLLLLLHHGFKWPRSSPLVAKPEEVAASNPPIMRRVCRHDGDITYWEMGRHQNCDATNPQRNTSWTLREFSQKQTAWLNPLRKWGTAVHTAASIDREHVVLCVVLTEVLTEIDYSWEDDISSNTDKVPQVRIHPEERCKVAGELPSRENCLSRTPEAQRFLILDGNLVRIVADYASQVSITTVDLGSYVLTLYLTRAILLQLVQNHMVELTENISRSN